MSRRGWTLFLLLGIAWGIPYLLIKVAVAEIPVPVLVFVRVTLGAAILLPLALRRPQRAGLAGHWGAMAVFATLEFILPWGLLSHAEIRISSSTAGLLMASIPILALVIRRLSGEREHIGGRRRLGLVAGFAGVLVLAGPDLAGDGWAIAEVLLAAICYAAAAVIAARRLGNVPALPMTAACLSLASAAYLVPAMTAWPDAVPSLATIAAITVLAVFCTAIAFIGFFELIREVGVTRTVVVTYLNPAVAVAAGALVLSEPLTSTVLLAFALILGGSVLATGGTRSAPTRGSPRGGERMVRANGVDLCVETFGDAGDPAILLIHGCCASMLWWERELCEAIAAGGRFVIRFDNRDTGRSTCYPPGAPAYSMSDMARDAIGILDALGVRRAHVVGRSMAGGIAAVLGIDHPDRVASLTFIATTTGDDDLPPMSAAYLEQVSVQPDCSDPDDVVEFIVRSLRAYSGGSPYFDEAATRELAREDVARTRSIASALGNHFAIELDGPRSGGLADIRAPTLVIHGEWDPVYPLAHGEALRDAVPGARLLVLRRAGHEVPRALHAQCVSALLSHTG